MQHLTRHSTKVNVIRAIVIISFAIWGISSYMNNSEKQERKPLTTYNWQLNTVIKTIIDTPAYSQANISKTLGVIPEGERLIVVSTANDGQWVKVKHGINTLWVQAMNIKNLTSN
ncbi:MAG: hypothetical protein GY793_06980 [Proteobacteria bacterium]|nr:hypothetical protein [Pseudomonadota bacterium]